MKSTAELDRVFPLSTGSWERPVLHAPRLAASIAVTSEIATGHRSFLRAWAARRAKPALGADRAESSRTGHPRESTVNLR